MKPSAFQMQEAALLHRRGDLTAAAARYEQVLTLEKRNHGALFGLATIHCQQGRLEQGIELARRAVKVEPKFAAAHNLIGVAQQKLGRAELALNQFDRAIAAEANFVEAWINRGNVLAALARRGHAIESFSRAIALRPDHVPALNARGTALMIDDRDEEAIADFDAAVARDPNFALAFANRGYLLNRLGRFEAAFADLARALALAPDDADVRYHAALVQLLHGQWREGWSNFKSRLTAPSLDSARTFIPPPYPRWRGEPPDGSLLVLFTEQGRGDVIQFARFATVLAAAGHRVAIATQPAYASIFANFAGARARHHRSRRTAGGRSAALGDAGERRGAPRRHAGHASGVGPLPGAGPGTRRRVARAARAGTQGRPVVAGQSDLRARQGAFDPARGLCTARRDSRYQIDFVAEAPRRRADRGRSVRRADRAGSRRLRYRRGGVP